jgi:DHA1 family inner membrane transport protein
LETQPVPRRILPVLVLSQLAGTSVWFAGNAVLGDLQRDWSLTPGQVGLLFAAVNLGFIAGTLAYAIGLIADRFSPRRVFFVSCMLTASCNALPAIADGGFATMVASRLAVGFFLAGVYPVGMKIASSWYRHGLGSALGFMIGALVAGTALPHLVHALGVGGSWRGVLAAVSAIAALGGLALLLWVPDGPYLKRGSRIHPGALRVIWRDRKVRASALGYFGHMWELYAMLAAVPAIVAGHLGTGPTPTVSLASFLVIAVGAIGCAIGGVVGLRVGGARVAVAFLATSGACCLLAPLMLDAPGWLFWTWLFVWGATVVSDSPQFSALTAVNSPPEVVGSVLTLVNSIGFAISAATIQASTMLLAAWPAGAVLPLLAIGPLFGVIAMRRLLQAGPAPLLAGRSPR